MYLGRPSCDPLEKGESRPCLRPGDFPSLASDPDKRVLTRTCCCWNSELSLLPFCFCLSARFFPLPGTPSSQVYWLSSTSHTCLIVVMEKSQQTSTLQKVANSEFGTTYLPLNCQSPAPTLEVMQSWGETQPLPGRWSSLRKPKNPFFKTSIIGRRMQNPCLPLPQPPWGIPAQAGAQPVGEVKPKTGGERPASCAGLRVDGDACEATGPTRGPGYQGPQTARAVGTGDRELGQWNGFAVALPRVVLAHLLHLCGPCSHCPPCSALRAVPQRGLQAPGCEACTGRPSGPPLRGGAGRPGGGSSPGSLLGAAVQAWWLVPLSYLAVLPARPPHLPTWPITCGPAGATSPPSSSPPRPPLPSGDRQPPDGPGAPPSQLPPFATSRDRCPAVHEDDTADRREADRLWIDAPSPSPPETGFGLLRRLLLLLHRRQGSPGSGPGHASCHVTPQSSGSGRPSASPGLSPDVTCSDLPGPCARPPPPPHGSCVFLPHGSPVLPGGR
ncbi:basic proline-rich protein-like isoform X2 [Felis catus]|uniref:basic proline-rich protein-like isoform X2 n=1 Tax=Felis catus TaxID=9685 RepID=UPI001D19C777|nr:basic proline-rich protein-like isoform X2 [Felis catus]